MAETKPKKKAEVKRKVPERRCVGCRGTFEKRNLLRVVRSPEGEISVDFTGKKSGRGAYLCKNLDCFKKAKKSGVLRHALECEISDEIMDIVEREIKFEMDTAEE